MLQLFVKRQPPFLLSDAFPEGWLPCPAFATVQALPDSNVKPKRPEWIREAEFRSLIVEPAPLLPQVSAPNPVSAVRTLHASIDRRLGTTGGEGNLFEVNSWHLSPNGNDSLRYLVVYIRTADWLERVVELFHSLSLSGFGKKRSAGRGAFRVVGDPIPCEWMDHTDGTNGFVSLSHFIPAADDPTEGEWRLLTKYPKFSPGLPGGSVFKGRVLMLRSGSAFRAAAPVRAFYGGVLKGIYSGFPEAVQYGLAFSVPVRWPESESL